MLFSLNLLLALAWAALWNDFTLIGLAVGLLAAYVALWFACGVSGRQTGYFRRWPRAIGLILFFLKELVLSCVNVARDVVSPHPRLHPAIVRMPLEPQSDLEIFLVSSLISLTPGTLSLDVSEDRRFLFVHSIYAADPEALVAELKSGMERRVMGVFQ